MNKRRNSLITLITILIIQLGCSSHEKINFIENGDSFKKLSDVIELEQFENKVLYIDLWGTKCPPCFDHFNYLPELKARFTNEPIEYVYLCSPVRGINNDSTWRSIVVEKELEGHHILISEQFYQDFWEVEMKDLVHEDRKWGIPFYIIVDKDGELAKVNARGPIDKENLYTQIESVLQRK
jgi:thiol-disulfide isomerase/thioredoxin